MQSLQRLLYSGAPVCVKELAHAWGLTSAHVLHFFSTVCGKESSGIVSRQCLRRALRLASVSAEFRIPGVYLTGASGIRARWASGIRARCGRTNDIVAVAPPARSPSRD